MSKSSSRRRSSVSKLNGSSLRTGSDMFENYPLFTEEKWTELLKAEEEDKAYYKLMNQMYKAAREKEKSDYIKKNIFPYLAMCCHIAWTKIINIYFQRCDPGEKSETIGEVWKDDAEPKCCPLDSWASQSLPVLSDPIFETESGIPTDDSRASTEGFDEKLFLSKIEDRCYNRILDELDGGSFKNYVPRVSVSEVEKKEEEGEEEEYEEEEEGEKESEEEEEEEAGEEEKETPGEEEEEEKKGEQETHGPLPSGSKAMDTNNIPLNFRENVTTKLEEYVGNPMPDTMASICIDALDSTRQELMKRLFGEEKYTEFLLNKVPIPIGLIEITLDSLPKKKPTVEAEHTSEAPLFDGDFDEDDEYGFCFAGEEDFANTIIPRAAKMKTHKKSEPAETKKLYASSMLLDKRLSGDYHGSEGQTKSRH